MHPHAPHCIQNTLCTYTHVDSRAFMLQMDLCQHSRTENRTFQPVWHRPIVIHIIYKDPGWASHDLNSQHACHKCHNMLRNTSAGLHDHMRIDHGRMVNLTKKHSASKVTSTDSFITFAILSFHNTTTATKILAQNENRQKTCRGLVQREPVAQDTAHIQLGHWHLHPHLTH